MATIIRYFALALISLIGLKSLSNASLALLIVCSVIVEFDNIFEELEGAVDNFYSKVEAAQSKQPTPEWED